MKGTKVFAGALALFLVLGLLPLSAAATVSTYEKFPEGTEINVYNWGMYIADGSDDSLDINKAFEEATGIKVNYTTYESNEAMFAKLKTGGSSYDVIIPSDYMIARLIQEDMLAPLDFANIPNYGYIDSAFRDQAYDPANRYSVPYTWGTVGLIYNTKYVTEEVTSWDVMWNEAYKGEILMFDNPRDSFAIAQFLLGHDINTEEEAQLQTEADLLKTQKPLVQSYVMDQIFDAMEAEEAWIGAYYAGDYLLMAETNPDLSFCFPEEGFNMFIDAMCIPKDAANKEAAEAYINFLCDPEISGQNMEYLGYSTPISAAKAFMDPDLASNEIAYPSEAVLARADSFRNLSPETTELMETLWLDVKAEGSNLTLIIVGAVVVIGLAGGLLVMNQSKKKKMAARKSMGSR